MCQGVGFIATENGYAPCECRRKADLIEKLTGPCRVPRKFLAKTIDNFEADNPHLKQILSEARAYIATFSTAPEDDGSACRGLVLRGPEGTGKTHMAVAILRAVISQGYQAMFYNVSDLFLDLRRTMTEEGKSQSEADLIHPLRSADLLVLDDLGMERASDYTREILYTVINSRYAEDRATIITTNCNKNELLERLGRSTTSRLQEMCLDLPFPEGDWRRRNMN
jgi:DNA replication protein DnaC